MFALKVVLYLELFSASPQSLMVLSLNWLVLLGSLTATATKTLRENISPYQLWCFAIISTRPIFTKMANYPGIKLVGVVYKLRKKMKNSPPCVRVLQKTLNMVISRCWFAEDGREMYQNVKQKYRAIVFAHKYIVLRSCRCRRRRRCLSWQEH